MVLVSAMKRLGVISFDKSSSYLGAHLITTASRSMPFKYCRPGKTNPLSPALGVSCVSTSCC